MMTQQRLDRICASFTWTILIIVVTQTLIANARPSLQYVSMSGDRSASVDMQSNVMIVSVQDVPDQVVCEKFDLEKGHIRLKAIYNNAADKKDDKDDEPSKPVAHAPDCSNNEPV